MKNACLFKGYHFTISYPLKTNSESMVDIPNADIERAIDLIDKTLSPALQAAPWVTPVLFIAALKSISSAMEKRFNIKITSIDVQPYPTNSKKELLN